MPASWRLIPLEEPADPAWNMAADEALLDAPPERSGEAALRFYRWREECLSIGYFQSVADIARRERRLMPIVRRITGGGIVRHGEDLTVSMSLPVPNPFFPAKALDSYRAIHALFIESLRGAFPGLRTVPTLSPLRPRSASDCFEEPTIFDVELGGRKVIGSSQRRRRGRMLHQTAVRLPGDPAAVARAVRGGFERTLGARFREEPFSAAEKDRIGGLAGTKYASEEFALTLETVDRKIA